MALDHYVSQVHLRNFCSPALGGKMHAIRKSDLKTFPCAPRSVCRIEQGNTNAYLADQRAVEEFLSGVEPRYNASLARLRENRLDRECIYVISGFVAYVASCAPAAMRIHAGMLKAALESGAAILDKAGLIPKAPPSLGGACLTELLAQNVIGFDVD